MNKYIELYIYIHKFISIQLYKKKFKKVYMDNKN